MIILQVHWLTGGRMHLAEVAEVAQELRRFLEVGGVPRALSHCTPEFGSRRSTTIEMRAMWVELGRLMGSMLDVYLSPKAAPVGDE